MTAPRDWDRELAQIDKLMNAPQPAPGTAVARTDAATRGALPATGAAPVTTRRAHVVGVWFRTLLGAAGAIALPLWPYNLACGTMLYLYLVGAGGVICCGIWAMRGAWVHRRGAAHVGGLLVLIAGLVLLAWRVVPHTGVFGTPLPWRCG